MNDKEQQTKPDGGASVSTAMLGASFPTTKWKVEPKYKDEVEAIEVVAETACFVTVRRQDWNGKTYSRRQRMR